MYAPTRTMEFTVIERVFSIPLVLETILLELPMQEVLLNAQRVNRTWNSIIYSSPILQQHLFFACAHHSSTHEPQWITNPLLEKKFPAWFRDVRETVHHFVDVNDPYAVTDYPGPYKYYYFAGTRDLQKSDWAANPDAYSRPDASWRRMLVMQPAINLLKILYANLSRKKWRRRRESREFPCGEGLRMGFFYDFVVEEIDEWVRRFGVQWNMFHVEEDLEAGEYQGEGDSLSWAPLIEKHEERGSVTLILEALSTTRDGMPDRRTGESRLGSNFKSRAADVGESEACTREGYRARIEASHRT